MAGPAIRTAAFVVTIGLAAALLRPLPVGAPSGHAVDFLDRSGLRLGTVLSSNDAHAASVPLERIAPAFVRAILAVEDDRFFRHGAVDAPGLVRALALAARTRRIPGGASTISMQLARLLHPVEAGPLGRIREVVVALRLVNALSKRAILEAYCNRLPMGGNVYGVEAAALTYFGVHAADLDLAQASLLAAIPNDPVGLGPYAHWRALRARARLVLRRMVAARRLTASEAARAMAENVALVPAGAGIVAAPHLQFRLALGAAAGTSVIRTTIDRPLQRFVEGQLRAVVATLRTHAVRDAAALVVDNGSGAVRAYAGSPDFFSDDALGRNDGVIALRQPGSALKPFLYELALERGDIHPNTVLLDGPVAYAIPGGRLYAPRDYDDRFLGPVRVRVALADSLNVPAVRVLEHVGVGPFLDRLHALGFTHLRKPATYYGLGLTLGGGEVTLEELTRAYATMAARGCPLDLSFSTSDGPGLRTSRAPADAAWSLVTDMLADAHARAAAFGVASVLALPFAAAVKTGTSSDFRDTWTVGFTRDYTVGVWVGNFDGSPMRDVSGVTGAAPLWSRIMLHLHAHREPQAFAPPAGYAHTPICADTGLRPGRSCRAVVLEWLRAADRLAFARPDPPVPPLTIGFPHDGDRFALAPGAGAQRIAVSLLPNARDATVAVDGRTLRRRYGAFTWDLRLGAHVIRARRGGAVALVRIAVERPPQRERDGFSDVR